MRVTSLWNAPQRRGSPWPARRRVLTARACPGSLSAMVGNFGGRGAALAAAHAARRSRLPDVVRSSRRVNTIRFAGMTAMAATAPPLCGMFHPDSPGSRARCPSAFPAAPAMATFSLGAFPPAPPLSHGFANRRVDDERVVGGRSADAREIRQVSFELLQGGVDRVGPGVASWSRSRPAAPLRFTPAAMPFALGRSRRSRSGATPPAC
jgi:hypothetical protein